MKKYPPIGGTGESEGLQIMTGSLSVAKLT